MGSTVIDIDEFGFYEVVDIPTGMVLKGGIESLTNARSYARYYDKKIKESQEEWRKTSIEKPEQKLREQ